VLAAVLGAVVFVFLVVFGNIVLAGKKEQIQELNNRKMEVEGRLRGYAQESADITFLKDWKNTSISWLDELYDLSAKFPDQKGFRIVSITANPSKKSASKEKFVASVILTGLVQPDDTTTVNAFVKEINKSNHLRATPGPTTTGTGKQSSFSLKVDLVKQAPDKYAAKIPLAKLPAAAQDDGDEDAGFGEGEQP
jgi:hypothetical protein